MNPDFNRLLAAPVADRRDLFLAAAARLGSRAVTDLAMAANCTRHERMFFKRAGTDTAVPGSFALVPPAAMLDQLRRDYEAMRVMIFGEVPIFQAVIDSIAVLEAALNRRTET